MHRQSPRHEWVLLGPGHTHLHILRQWRMRPIEGVRLTCIANHAYATYSGMLPGVLAGDYSPEQMRVDLVRRCAAVGARLLVAETAGLDRSGRRVLFHDRPPLAYDLLSIGIGSRPAEVPGIENALSIKPMQSFLQRLERRLESLLTSGTRSVKIAVVGGGAGGVEVALCLPQWVRNRPSSLLPEMTLVHRGSRILNGASRRAAHIVQHVLDQRGTRTLLEHEAVRLDAEGVWTRCAGGALRHFPADVVIWAAGAVGPRLLEAMDLTTDARGFLVTNRCLQSVDDPSIFVVGDSGICPSEPHPRAGVYAVRQGPVLWENLQRSLAGRPLRAWTPQRDFLSLLNTGDGRAILQYGRFATRGRWCWYLKDRIDRRFMAMHQRYDPPMMHAGRRGVVDPAPMRCDGCGGKVSSEVLRRVLSGLENPRTDRVEVGIEDAEDVAVVGFARHPAAEDAAGKWAARVVATTDFFSAFLDDPYLVGRVAALNALSDLFAKGTQPVAAIAQAVIPPGDERYQEQTLAELMAGVLRELRVLGVPLVGGHTIEGERVVVGLCLLGEPGPSGVVRRKGGLRVGDALVLTKPLGTGVLLAAHRMARCEADEFDGLVRCLLQSNQLAASVADEAALCGATDVTGFGLMGHLLEMLEASELTAEIDVAAVPLLPGTVRHLDEGVQSTLAPANRKAAMNRHWLPANPGAAYQAMFDPQTSGGLLLGVPERAVADVLRRLQSAATEREEWPPAVIGRVVRQQDRLVRLL